MTRRNLNLVVGAILALCLAPITGAQESQDSPHPHVDGVEEVDPRLCPVPMQREDVPERTPKERLSSSVSGPDGPTTTSTRWSDSFEDDIGLTWMERAVAIDGEVVLSQTTALGYAVEGGSVLAMAVGSNGKIYLGTSGAYLNVYDPSTGSMTSLGAPVPDECFG